MIDFGNDFVDENYFFVPESFDAFTFLYINMVSEESDVDAYINQKWFNLNADVEKSVVEKWWNTLKSSYTRPHRKYHTFFHVKRMLTHMDSLINEIQNKDAVSYAIFFHDVAYDPRSQENEDRSVEIFNEFCTESELSKDSPLKIAVKREFFSNEELVAKVKELILALKAHCTDEHKKEGLFGKDDLHYFLDFDMSVLGSDPAEYKKYTQQIKEEYYFMPKSKYNIVRSKILEHFLQIPNIYATQEFQEKYEKQARSNIQSEIEWLKVED
ncbi:uncharacterized protein TNIN_126881 [Trichonephila inaurata madagascariensis]|uniref:Metal-dependent HD superfamily phosphohydrolase n=1 Tax=Trichonephila inaurata madagascariensis TaxID=2747483 RepID=A0A8X6XMA9_9ARAC|nr:uncharacterized protein TNIN_126881 [Trichonephila inaurata madagascariensis]